MMCFRKKRIKNRVLDEHRSGFDKYYIKAPCCKCPDCRKSRTNDWLVRSYFEFMDNDRRAYFVTLDFDNEHLPNWHGVPCFDSDIIHKFFDRLRYYIGKFRYLYATDYGGFLRRPHYHVMLIPDNKLLSPTVFFPSIHKCWQHGTHTDIEQVASVHHDKLKAISYICKYVTKDITFVSDVEDVPDSMPLRFRPRVQSSKGWGALPLEDGRINIHMLNRGERILLPIGKNGVSIPFTIPRYYEMKLCYNSIYHPETRRQELVKNEFGIELAKIRHNVHYKHYIRSFFSSRLWNISTENTIFANSSWYNVVKDCLSYFDDFKEFVYFRDFLSYCGSTYVFDNIRNESLFRPNWHIYNFACDLYDKEVDIINKAKDKFMSEKLVESAKARARAKIKNNPRLLLYLRRKHFNFNLIY